MKPVILDAAGDGETPSFRWRTFRALADGVGCGLVFYSGPEWAVHLYLGPWLIGIERTREEDD